MTTFSRICSRLLPLIEKGARSHFVGNPMGRAARTLEEFHSLHEKTRGRRAAEVSAYVEETGFPIDDDWLAALALQTQVIFKASEVCYEHGRVLYSALRTSIANRHLQSVNILETGTARGFSALCIAKALADAQCEGRIVTCDLIPHETPITWNCVADLEGPRTRVELLNDYRDLIDRYIWFLEGDTRITFSRLMVGRVHFAFLDGAHSGDAVRREFGHLAARQNQGDVVVFDDYNPDKFPGIVSAVDEMCEQHGYTKRSLKAWGGRAYVIASRV